ncbi:MAG: signal peptidase II [Dehalococcoidia bacterium]|tara:strand:+ start:426 stop:920 length:495 start_codon:yes stop_codon:yes gene_type:complete
MIWYRDWIFYSTSVAIFILDQISKEVIRRQMPLYGSWPEEGFFRIVHGLNTGSAFGLFAGFTNVLIIASIVGIGVVLYYFQKQEISVVWHRLSIGLIVGGALGNLFDRIKDGAVVDFISVGWWPAFNIADSSISVGMVLLIVILLFGERFGWIQNTDDNGKNDS